MIRPGWPYSLVALLLAGLCTWMLRSTATRAIDLATWLGVLALVLVAVGLIAGSRMVVGASVAPVLGAVVLESALNDQASWLAALIVGCMWFVTIEVAWEALDRRDGSLRTAASIAVRLQEVSMVIGLSLILGLLASAASPLAPVRSVLLQAMVLAVVLSAFVMLMRRVSASIR